MKFKDHIEIIKSDEESMKKIQEILNPIGIKSEFYVSNASHFLVHLVYSNLLENESSKEFILMDAKKRLRSY